MSEVRGSFKIQLARHEDCQRCSERILAFSAEARSDSTTLWEAQTLDAMNAGLKKEVILKYSDQRSPLMPIFKGADQFNAAVIPSLVL